MDACAYRVCGSWRKGSFLETRHQGAARSEESYARENGLLAALRDRPSNRVGVTLGGYGQGARGDLGAVGVQRFALRGRPSAPRPQRFFRSPSFPQHQDASSGRRDQSAFILYVIAPAALILPSRSSSRLNGGGSPLEIMCRQSECNSGRTAISWATYAFSPRPLLALFAVHWADLEGRQRVESGPGDGKQSGNVSKGRISAIPGRALDDGNAQIAVMSGRRPVVKGLFEAAVNVSGAVMSSAC